MEQRHLVEKVQGESQACCAGVKKPVGKLCALVPHENGMSHSSGATLKKIIRVVDEYVNLSGHAYVHFV